jgi:hypothetical protein
MQWSLPANNELVGLWLVAPFSGDFFISPVNFPSVLLMAAATLEFARLLGLSQTFRHLAALAVVSTNPMLRQLVCAENDITVAAMFVAVLCYAVRFARDGRQADLLLGAASLGLLAGVKFYALGYAAVAWTSAVLLTRLIRGRRCAIRLALIWIIGAVTLSGYWYLRNTLITGSPVYPVGTSPANDLQGEIYPGMWGTTFLGNGHPEILWLAIEAIQKIAGPCHVVTFLCLPISLLWLGFTAIRLCRREETRPDGAVRLALCVAVILAGLVLLVTPFAVEDKPGTLNHLRWGGSPVRYGTCYLSLTVVSFAWLLDRIHTKCSGNVRRAFQPIAVTAAGEKYSVSADSVPLNRLRFWRVLPGQFVAWTLPLLFAGLIAYQFVVHIERIRVQVLDSLLLAADVLMLAIIFSLVWDGWSGWRRVVVWAGLATSLAGASIGTFHLGHWWHLGFARNYDRHFSGTVFTRLATEEPTGTHICVLDHRPYPFFGSGRQYGVCQPSMAPSYEELVRFLTDRQVTIVASHALEDPDQATTGRFRWTYLWLMEHPDRFELIERGFWFAVFRFRR